MKHVKTTILATWGNSKLPPHDADLPDFFDDRTLASLVGANVAHPADEMADLIRGLDRWGDRRVKG